MLEKKDKPLYFYHLVDKNADIKEGLYSIQYMYDNKLYNLFDKSVEKYKDRITNGWNLLKYKNKQKLTRLEYINALNEFRGKYGSSYIYFFKFPPYKELGKNMENVLKNKKIYRININDKKILENVKDMFYGYDMSNSDNNILDKSYYENITDKEYFSKYDDDIDMIFSRLNHIGIAFKNDICKSEFLEEIK